MALAKGYPFELQGRLAEATDVCESAVEATRLADNPQYLFWALSELAWAHYYTGNLDAAIDACEESARIGKRMAGGTMPASGGGPGWALGCALFEAGEVERAHEIMHSLGPDDLPHKIPVEKCFDWEILALVELALGHLEAAEGYVVRAEENAAKLGALHLPEALALRARAALLLAPGEPLEAAELALESAEMADAIGAALVAGYSREPRGPRPGRGGRTRARDLRAARRPSASSTASAPMRVRDEMRRELRKLGARAETRGPATGEDSGIEALTKRELEIADLVTDRMTNKEIAAELFLSEKTIESHIRNIFIKLGASSRVEVARDDGAPPPRAGAGAVEAGALRPDADAARLRELGYDQELDRKLGVLRQRGGGLRGHLARRRALRGGVRGHHRRRARLGVGAAGRAGRPVPSDGGLLGPRLGVPDLGRRVPVEPAAGGRRVRLDGRLGGDLRLRRGEHHHRLPRRAVGAHPARDRRRPRRRSCSPGWSWWWCARWWAR